MKISVRIKFLIAMSFMVCLGSCKKMLNEYNPSGNTAETVYTTPEGFETLVNAAYTYNKFWYGKEEGFGVSEMGTDLWTAGEQSFIAVAGASNANRALILYQNLNPVNQNLTMLWGRMYAAVNLCNTGIKLKDDGVGFDPNTQSVAHLRFLRAWYYWHIVETWGGVHFTTEPTTTVILTANRTPVLAFYAQIVTDLDAAIADLSITSSVYGRVNKNVATAFLARVLLTRGYITQDPADFTRARDLALSVANSSIYSLVPKYEDLWSMDVAKQHNKEVIWSVNYSTDVTLNDSYNAITNPFGYGMEFNITGRGNNNGHLFFIPGYDTGYDSTGNTGILNRDTRYGRAFIRFKPTKFLFDLFDETKDSRYSGSFQTVWKLNKTGVGRLVGKTVYKDTALYITKNAPASTRYYTFDVYKAYLPSGASPISNATIANQSNRLFPALKKFQDSTRSTSPNDIAPLANTVASAKDVYVIRNAEMWMIAAEAEFKLNGASANAVTYLNVVRARAEIFPGLLTSTTVAELAAGGIDFILDERAREFAGEQIRWFDLKRTGTLASRIAAHNPDVALYGNGFVAGKNEVRPIPQVQIDAITNKSEFTQNPGY